MALLKKIRWYHPVIVLFIVFSVYLMTGYQALQEVQPYLQSNAQVTVDNQEVISFLPQTPNGQGVIFYPGGKVAPEAYTPLMNALAQKGYSSFIVKMPYNLAVFNIEGAKQVLDQHPEIQSWSIGGHSLGGVMATEFAVKNKDVIHGIFYLASYPAKDLKSEDQLNFLSIYASKDGFVTLKQQSKYDALLPPGSEKVTIIGGNHSQFGYYGFQEGDGIADISRENQQSQVLEALTNWLSEVE